MLVLAVDIGRLADLNHVTYCVSQIVAGYQVLTREGDERLGLHERSQCVDDTARRRLTSRLFFVLNSGNHATCMIDCACGCPIHS